MKKDLFAARTLAFTLVAASLLIVACNPRDPFKPDRSDKGVLINAVTWSTRNLEAPGVFAATPESPGMLYQWNRRTGWSATDPLVPSPAGQAWDTSSALGEKWEAANDPCPEGWRLPTRVDFTALCNTDEVTSEWVKATETSPAGRRFTYKLLPGNSIFLPAMGYRDGVSSTLVDPGRNGNYWSATPGGSTSAVYLYFGDSRTNLTTPYDRNSGFSVRCVKDGYWTRGGLMFEEPFIEVDEI